jgi:hypothetical protein
MNWDAAIGAMILIGSVFVSLYVLGMALFLFSIMSSVSVILRLMRRDAESKARARR